MALTELLAAIEDDAALELERARRSAEEQADVVLQEAREQVQRHTRQVRRQAGQQAASEAAQALAQAHAGAAERFRAAREQALDRVLATARDQLADVRGRPDYPGQLAQLLSQAIEAAGSLERVHVDPRDETVARHLLRSRPGLEVVPDLATAGGVVVDGVGRHVDNTLEQRLQAAWPALRSRISRTWEHPEDGPPDPTGPEPAR
jgi:vacuolar-type H+-ATPase subunit E/Vma4